MTDSGKNNQNQLPQPEQKNVSGLSIFWMRRDLRLNDNAALYHALSSGMPALIVFIFDDDILEDLPENDPRISFIYSELIKINRQLREYSSSLMILKGDCHLIWKQIISSLPVKSVSWNKDYEPYALERDKKVAGLLRDNSIETNSYKDILIFEKSEVSKDDSSPYTVFTPFSRKWLKTFEHKGMPEIYNSSGHLNNLVQISCTMPSLESLGFKESSIKARNFSAENIADYDKHRDYPALDATTYAGVHLRFGTISIRELVRTALMVNRTYLNELIWREFFMQILYHFPDVVNNSFRPGYDSIKWINDTEQFERWCMGKTGYPIVDAGMRQLNATGFMHNRVRMISAGFLCKHLLCDWRWGERYFAGKLLDYELASNNGNWQWAAGTGCDAAPWFRVFNPLLQAKKFDKDNIYIKQWVPEFNSPDYPNPVVDHSFARKRAIETYRYYLKDNK